MKQLHDFNGIRKQLITDVPDPQCAITDHQLPFRLIKLPSIRLVPTFLPNAEISKALARCALFYRRIVTHRLGVGDRNAPIIETLGIPDRCQFHFPDFRLRRGITGFGLALRPTVSLTIIGIPLLSMPR